MNKNSLFLIPLMLVLSIILINTLIYKEKTKIQKSLNYNLSLKEQAQKIDHLKTKWTKKSKKELKKLKNSPLIQNISKKGKNTLIEYKTLNSKELDKVSNKILNSTVKLKHFVLSRVDEHNATLSVEVAN